MNIETAALVTKGLCFVVIGGLGPLVSGLGQWTDTGQWPPAINWCNIVAGCLIGAATQMLAFLSQSFGNWKAQRTVDRGGTAPQFTKEPKAETKG